MPGAFTLQPLPVHALGGGFRAQQIGRAHLNGAGAQRAGSPDPCRGGNAAGGDHRQGNGVANLWQQAEGTLLQAEVVTEEMAAMAAGLQPLGNHPVGTVLCQPEGFFYRGGAGQHPGPSGFYPRQQGRGRQAVMEAHHRRAKPFQHRRAVFVEGLPGRAAGNGRGIRCEFLIERPQGVHPALLPCRVRRRSRVAEKIHIPGLVGGGRQLRQLFFQPLGTEHPRRHGSQPAGLAHCRSQAPVLHAGHGGLNQGKVGSKQGRHGGSGRSHGKQPR